MSRPLSHDGVRLAGLALYPRFADPIPHSMVQGNEGRAQSRHEHRSHQPLDVPPQHASKRPAPKT